MATPQGQLPPEVQKQIDDLRKNPAMMIMKLMEAFGELTDSLDSIKATQEEIKKALKAVYALDSEVKVKVDFLQECVQRNTGGTPVK